MTFLKLTIQNTTDIVYVNMAQIITMEAIERRYVNAPTEYSTQLFSITNTTYHVKERAEEIVEMLKKASGDYDPPDAGSAFEDQMKAMRRDAILHTILGMDGTEQPESKSDNVDN